MRDGIAIALDSPVDGQGLKPGTLRDQLGPGQTILVFLRHNGWIFAHEMVRDLRRSAEHNPDYPAILLAQQGTVEQGRDWLERLWPEARAIADPERHLSRLFGIERGSIGQLASFGAIGCAVRAAVKGNRGGLVVGDPKLMPGLFAFDGDRLIWQHDFRNVGDHPDFDAIPALIAGATVLSD